MKNLQLSIITITAFILFFSCEDKQIDVVDIPIIRFNINTLSISQKLGNNQISCIIRYENPYVRLDKRPTDIGICWTEVNRSPTINDNKKEVKIEYASYYDGVGKYTNPFIIDNLEVGKTYYFDTYVKVQDSVYYGRNYGAKLASFKTVACETTTPKMTFRQLNNPNSAFYFDLYTLFTNDNDLYGISTKGEVYLYNKALDKWAFTNYIDPLLPFIEGGKLLIPFTIKNEIYCNFQSNDFTGSLNKVWKYNKNKEYWEGISVLTNRVANNLSYLFSTDSTAVFFTSTGDSSGGNILFWEYNPQKNTLINSSIFEADENYIIKDFVKNGNNYYFVLNNYNPSSPQSQIFNYDFVNKKIVDKSINNLLNTSCFKDFQNLTQKVFSYKNKFYSFIISNKEIYLPPGSKSLIVNQLYVFDEKQSTFQPVNRSLDEQDITSPRFFPTNDKLYCIMRNNLYEVILE